MLTLGAWYVNALAASFLLVSIFMMLVILIQKPKGGGLSGAFGGAGGGSAQAAFGAKTGDVLTIVTVVCFALFLLLAMGLTWTIRPVQEQIRLEQEKQAASEQRVVESEIGTAGGTMESSGLVLDPEPSDPTIDTTVQDPPPVEAGGGQAPDAPQP